MSPRKPAGWGHGAEQSPSFHPLQIADILKTLNLLFISFISSFTFNPRKLSSFHHCNVADLIHNQMVLLLKHERFHFYSTRDIRLITVRQFGRLMDERSMGGNQTTKWLLRMRTRTNKDELEASYLELKALLGPGAAWADPWWGGVWPLIACQALWRSLSWHHWESIWEKRWKKKKHEQIGIDCVPEITVITQSPKTRK